MLNPDIGGSMTESILKSSKILRCDCCGEIDPSIKVNQDGENIEQVIHPQWENLKIILEIYKFFGREMNVVVAYDFFEKIMKKTEKQTN